MGEQDDINTSLAHIILCIVAGKGVGSGFSGRTFTHPGMHANFFLHGILGILHYQSGTFKNDFTSAYMLSLKASKYLALPCLMADLYSSDQTLQAVHLLSGVVPFVLYLVGNDNAHLGHLMIAGNVVSLAYYSHKRSSEWGWYTVGGALLAYFVTWQMKHPSHQKLLYPLALSLLDYCARRIFHVSFSPHIRIESVRSSHSDVISAK